jgi:predicted PurR-regulated permease PerM
MAETSYTAPADGPTPIPISPRLRNILVLAGLALLVLLLWAAPGVVTVLLGGATLALVLSFPVRLLAHALPRGLAILLVLLGLLLAIAIALVALIPLVMDQLNALIVAAPDLAAQAERAVRDLLRPLREGGYLGADPDQVIDNIEQGLIGRAQALAQVLLTWIVGTLSGALGTVLQLFGILFVAIYLLADIRRFKAAYLRVAPHPYRDDAAALWEALGQSLSRYLGGLVVSLAVQGGLAWLGLTLLGVPYALLLGLWMAVTALLPYVGAWLGAIPAVIIAAFDSPMTALLTAVLYLVINQVEGNVLTPRIQGQAVNVHPLLVFVAVLAGGEVAGLAGLVFAVPLLAVVRVLVDFFAARLYVRRPPPPDTAAPPRAAAVAAPGAATPHSVDPAPALARHELGPGDRGETTDRYRPRGGTWRDDPTSDDAAARDGGKP